MKRPMFAPITVDMFMYLTVQNRNSFMSSISARSLILKAAGLLISIFYFANLSSLFLYFSNTYSNLFVLRRKVV